MRKMISVAVLLAALSVVAVAAAASSPAVTAGTVSGIADTSAVLNGTVDPNGEAATYQFDWGLTPSLGNVSPATPASAGAGTVAVAESAKLTGLSPDATYYYELRASNASGSSSTATETFKTSGNAAPTSTTDPATNVGPFAATLVGTVNPDAQTTSYYFQYGLTSDYTAQTNVQTLAAGTSAVTVTADVPGIEPGTIFHYRLVASHGSTSTTVGNDVTFQTVPFPRPKTHLSLAATASSRLRFSATGRIILPDTTPSSYGCHGTVRVRFYFGVRLLGTRSVPLGLTCRYDVSNAHFGGAARGALITAHAYYEGDLYDGPSEIGTARVTAR